MRRMTQRPPRPVPTNCRFCNHKEEPTYRKWEILASFVSERGKIIPKSRTGLCSRHQRHVADAVKRARHLALLPFVVRPL
ncbi:30S ribosomal protein S18 [Candidatus Roizmanbacteria bacterium]|nr:30S ribosomal protein S18 [Candidatus Roizmanbacteria bacterium]